MRSVDKALQVKATYRDTINLKNTCRMLDMNKKIGTVRKDILLVSGSNDLFFLIYLNEFCNIIYFYFYYILSHYIFQYYNAKMYNKLFLISVIILFTKFFVMI